MVIDKFIKALEATYDYKANVYTYHQFLYNDDDPDKYTKPYDAKENHYASMIGTGRRPSLLYEQIPCALIFKSFPVSDRDDMPSSMMTIKMICSTRYTIPPNSDMVITIAGRPVKFIASSIAAVYDTHQEIMLKDTSGVYYSNKDLGSDGYV